MLIKSLLYLLPLLFAGLIVNGHQQIPPPLQKKATTLLKQNNIPADVMIITEVLVDELGFTLIRGDRCYKNMPVFPEMTKFVFNKEDKLVFAGHTPQADEVPATLTPQITAAVVEQAFKERKHKNAPQGVVQSQLYLYETYTNQNDKEEYRYQLAWKVTYQGTKYPYLLVDAQTGKDLYYDDGIRY